MVNSAATTSQYTRDNPEELLLACIDCGAGGMISWSISEYPGIRLYPGVVYRCQACTAEKKKKQNRLIEAGVFERIDQLLSGIREVRDLVQEP